MAPKPEIPDPSKSMDQPIEEADTPQIIIPNEEEGEDSDNQDSEFGPMTGYQLLPQENNNYDDNYDEENDEDEEDDGLSMEEKIAALMKQSEAALEEWNISDGTRSLVEESKVEQAKQVAEEQAEVWKAAAEARNIDMDKDKVETIKSVMAKIKLSGNIPQWAMEGRETAWKDKLMEKIDNKKS